MTRKKGARRPSGTRGKSTYKSDCLHDMSYMSQWLEWAAVAFIVVSFSALLDVGFKYWDFHRIVIGRDRKVPYRLPLFSFFWTVSTALLFYAWRKLGGAAATESGHHYFSAGWGPTLVLFNVRIDTWWKYSIILCYQVGGCAPLNPAKGSFAALEPGAVPEGSVVCQSQRSLGGLSQGLVPSSSEV